MSGPDATALRARARVLAALRHTLHDWGYLEVPTPVRVPSPAVEPTLQAVPAAGAWLRTSPEQALKRVVAAGLPRIYEIGPCLRDDEVGPWHACEFTMLEWYRAGATLPDLMDEVQALVAAAAHALGVEPPTSWTRTTVRELVRTHTGLDLASTPPEVLSPRDADAPSAAFFRRWIEDVEPHLTEPTFVLEWPADQAALARVREHRDWPVACRFEAYLGGVELANAFLELTDGTEQARRIDVSARERADAGQPPHPVDPDFLDAVDRLPPCAGIALGVDRLVAVLAGWDSIHPGRVASGLGVEQR